MLVERTGAAAAAAAAVFEQCSLCASDTVGARDNGVGELLPSSVDSTGRASSLPLNERVAGTAAGSSTCGCSGLGATLSDKESDWAGAIGGAEANARKGASVPSTTEALEALDMAEGATGTQRPKIVYWIKRTSNACEARKRKSRRLRIRDARLCGAEGRREKNPPQWPNRY